MRCITGRSIYQPQTRVTRSKRSISFLFQVTFSSFWIRHKYAPINLSYDITFNFLRTLPLPVFCGSHMKFSFGGHIRHSPVTSISELAPYSALILSIVLVVLFLIRFYILQRFLLEKLHGSTYTQLDDATRRSFLNHYIAGATKLTILIVALYPFASVTFGTANFHTPYVHGSRVTMGDLLLVAAQMLTGM